jgi:LuxR family transcriptional regulator
MESWHQPHVESLLVAEDETSFFDILHELVEQMGFDYYAFGMRLPLPVTKPQLVQHDNYPPAWSRPKAAVSALLVGTAGTHGARSASPFVWSNDFPAAHLTFWDDAKAHGLKAGWGQACHGPMGISSVLNIATADPELSLRQLDDLSPQLSWLTQAAHRRLSTLLVPKYLPEARISLTQKEAEILRWTADGKTSSAIGRALYISERTVNFHMEHILQKLAAPNKTAAALKAAMLGLL